MCIYFCKERRSIASVRITSFRASICVIPDSNPHYVIFIQTYTQTYMHSHFGINRRIALNFENASSPHPPVDFYFCIRDFSYLGTCVHHQTPLARHITRTVMPPVNIGDQTPVSVCAYIRTTVTLNPPLLCPV